MDSISEIRARMGAGGSLGEEKAGWDQRPGAFEATRAPAPLVVVGGRHDRQGWQVLLLRGGVTEAALEPAAARALAEQLHQMADVCDGGRW